MKKAIIFSLLLLAPISVFGQGTGTLPSVIAVVGNIIRLLTSIAATLSIVVFFYGLALFILNSSDEKKIEEGKSWMLWSVIALFVLITIWGIVGLLQRTVGNEYGPGKVNIVIPTF